MFEYHEVFIILNIKSLFDRAENKDGILQALLSFIAHVPLFVIIKTAVFTSKHKTITVLIGIQRNTAYIEQQISILRIY